MNSEIDSRWDRRGTQKHPFVDVFQNTGDVLKNPRCLQKTPLLESFF